ncbi:hypothetical protein [uncultured Draconibacterium sp.]
MENVILYGTGSALIVDFEEVCLRNDVFIEAVVNNIENGESYAINQDKEI